MRVDPPPYRDTLAHVPSRKATLFGEPGMMTAIWQGWIQKLAQALGAVVSRIGRVSVTAQGASIPATVLPTSQLATAEYRVSYTARVLRPASMTSSLTVTVGWVHGGVSCSQSGAALTGNTTATQQNGTMLISVDAGSSVTYATTYASAGTTTMTYMLTVLVESV